MEHKTTIIIADDHPIVRSGLRLVVERDPKLAILHEADNGDKALQLIRQYRPDIAILDVEMPVMDGFAVANAIRAESIRVGLIFITMHNDERTFNKALDAGVKGYVLKENAVSDILDAIAAVIDGRYYLSPTLTDYLMRRKSPSRASSSGVRDLDILTPAERNILRLIGEQKTSQTIADELFISPKTVEKHRSNICTKLGLHGSYALLKFTLDNKSRI